MTHLGLLTLLHELPGSVALHDLVAEAGDVEHHTATHQSISSRDRNQFT